MTAVSVRRDRQLGERDLPHMPSVGRRVVVVDDPLAAVRAGICPYCGAGPFSVVATHARWAHGVDRFELRDDIGVTKTASICDPAVSRARAAMSKRHYLDGVSGISDPAVVLEGMRRGGRRFSKAGRAAQQRKARLADPAKVGAAGSAAYARRTAERDAAIIARYEAGETLKQIAAHVGLSQSKTIRAVLRRHGYEARDGLERYWASMRGVQKS